MAPIVKQEEKKKSENVKRGFYDVTALHNPTYNHGENGASRKDRIRYRLATAWKIRKECAFEDHLF